MPTEKDEPMIKSYAEDKQYIRVTYLHSRFDANGVQHLETASMMLPGDYAFAPIVPFQHPDDPDIYIPHAAVIEFARVDVRGYTKKQRAERGKHGNRSIRQE